MFALTNMAALSQRFSWHEKGSLKIQLAVFLGVFFVSSLFFYIKYEKFLYYFVIFIFLTTPISLLWGNGDQAPKSVLAEGDNQLLMMVRGREPVITPDIYLLLYDAYVPNETMLAYGIDNHAQEQYLESLGFKLYPQTYSVGHDTLGTMSRLFNASTDHYGNTRKGVSGNGVVNKLLESFGYKTYGIFFWHYFFRGVTPNYDYLYPPYSSSKNVLIKAVATGEFIYDVDDHRVSREQFLAERERFFSTESTSPKFVYLHTDRPTHSQNSGVCRPNEVELYAERVIEANEAMKQDIEEILSNNPDAIIIVAGDHGPSVTKNCVCLGSSYDVSEISRLDIQDRYATFLAIKWPSQDYEKYDNIVVLQDIFPSIFAYMFQDVSILDAKIDPVSIDTACVDGITLNNGIIEGGIYDGEPLFLSGNK